MALIVRDGCKAVRTHVIGVKPSLEMVDLMLKDARVPSLSKNCARFGSLVEAGYSNG